VSLDVDRTHETLTERTFDPENRVVKTQTTSDMSDSSSGQNAAVTVASNLPEGAAGGGNNTSDRTESSEKLTYEISEIIRNREILPGAIKRMTIAVLVDDQQIIAEDGTVTVEPRSEAELEILRDLVASASGLDEERGDNLTVRALTFNKPAETDFVVKPSLVDQFMEQYLWSTIQALILGFVALVLGLFVVKPLLTQRADGAGAIANLPDGTGSNAAELLPMELGDGGFGQGELPTMALEQGSAPLGIEGPGAMGGALGGAMGMEISTESDPMDQLNSKASEQVDDATELLASWLSVEAQPG
jgi:flagellar M-ring protein FliF